MDVKDAILTRRTIFKFKQEPVPNDVIEQVFSFGIWAPNHHVTEPWRFTVIGGETKLILADRYREIKMEDTPDHVDAVNLAKIGELAYEKFMSKPTIIAVSCIQDGDEQRRREGLCRRLLCYAERPTRGVGYWSRYAVEHRQNHDGRTDVSVVRD